jgi:hypothetical protein
MMDLLALTLLIGSVVLMRLMIRAIDWMHWNEQG